MVVINQKNQFWRKSSRNYLNSNLKDGFREILDCGNLIEHIFLMKTKNL